MEPVPIRCLLMTCISAALFAPKGLQEHTSISCTYCVPYVERLKSFLVQLVPHTLCFLAQRAFPLMFFFLNWFGLACAIYLAWCN